MLMGQPIREHGEAGEAGDSETGRRRDMERPRAMKSQRDRDTEAEADLGGRAPFIPRAPSLQHLPQPHLPRHLVGSFLSLQSEAALGPQASTS